MHVYSRVSPIVLRSAYIQERVHRIVAIVWLDLESFWSGGR